MEEEKKRKFETCLIRTRKLLSPVHDICRPHDTHTSFSVYKLSKEDEQVSLTLDDNLNPANLSRTVFPFPYSGR